MPSLPEIAGAIPTIVSLIIIEGLLSVDNALAIAAMAAHLPRRQKFLALRLGIVGAYAFRGLALAFAHVIIRSAWLKILGAAYLIHLMADHFAKCAAARAGGNADAAGRTSSRGFWSTVIAIEVMDLSLSVDNVVAAVAMSPKFWVVCTGVFLGILTMRFIAGACIRLIEKFPILEEAAFLLIGYVGVLLIVELTAHTEIAAGPKFLGICIILASSLAFSKSPAMQRTLSPFLSIARWPCVAYAAVSSRIFGVLILPLKLLFALFKKKDPTCPAKTHSPHPNRV